VVDDDPLSAIKRLIGWVGLQVELPGSAQEFRSSWASKLPNVSAQGLDCGHDSIHRAIDEPRCRPLFKSQRIYPHSNEDEVIFLFLIIGSEGILVHDESRGFVCAARSGKVRDYLFAYGY
jgi:hypothetical protein